MAQRDEHSVPDDVLIRFVDGLLRALVLVVLFFGYLAWLGRSPIPALLVGCAVAAGVRAWCRVRWAGGGRREPAKAGGLRATQIEDVDLMTGREFQELITWLMRRDSFVGVRPTGLRDDLSIDVVGRTPTGRKVVVQCNRDAPRHKMSSPAVQRVLGTVHDEHSADIAVLVTTGRFTRSALAFGERRGVVLLDRSQLGAWLTGRTTRLTAHLATANAGYVP